MRQVISILFTLFSVFSLSLSAQVLTVNKSESAERALQQIDKIKQPTEAMGYRIGIFFDNGHEARSKATEAKEQFTAAFPSQPVYMVYESPYYKVSVGNCLTEEEAIMLFERVRPLFPNAYVMREKMKIIDFIETQPAELPQIDSIKVYVLEKEESEAEEAQE